MPTLLSADHKERLLAICEEKGGELVTEYREGRKISLRCEQGHAWHPYIYNVLGGSWCGHPDCVAERLLKANAPTKDRQRRRLCDAIESKGGKWISGEYVNRATKIEVECALGHTWNAIPDSIRSGSWCPRCAGKIPKTEALEVMHKIAKARGGKCLSKKYTNKNTKLLWECDKGHRWEAVPGNVKSNGSWCPKCFGSEKLGIEYMREIAASRGGECLSSEYISNHTKLQYRCAFGHEWETSAIILMKGSWCPVCSEGLGERICRTFFEQLFSEEFPKSRPKWLEGKYGVPLELDGFCEELAIAFEHQGKQHYSPRFASASQFSEICERDAIKRDICNRRGVTLIDIPEIPDLTPISKIKELIRKSCEDAAYCLPSNFDAIEVDLKSAYQSNREIEELSELRDIAEGYKGSLLSSSYLGSKSPLLFRCKEGHEWEARPNNIKNGSWCPKCSGVKRLTIEGMQQLARSRGGKCLSKKYVNIMTPLLWECRCGHRWESAPNNVRNAKSWCPNCGLEKRGETRRKNQKRGFD